MILKLSINWFLDAGPKDTDFFLQNNSPPPTQHIQIVLLVSAERFHISSYSLQHQQHLDSEEIQSYFCLHWSILGLSRCQQIFLNPSVTFNLNFNESLSL